MSKEYVDIKDENLLKAINKALKKSEWFSKVTKEEIESLTELHINYYEEVKDISGLEYAANLKHFTLRGCGIEDISLIKNLINLRELNLGDNKIKNISSLSNLNNLVSLTLDRNDISDISPLKDLKNLNKLDIEKTK